MEIAYLQEMCRASVRVLFPGFIILFLSHTQIKKVSPRYRRSDLETAGGDEAADAS